MIGGSPEECLRLLALVSPIALLPVALNLVGRLLWGEDDWLDERLGRGSIKDCWPYDRLGRPGRR